MDQGARFPAVKRRRGHYESFYIKACRPGGGRGSLDPPHGPQAARGRAEGLDLVHVLRRGGRRPARDQDHRRPGAAVGADGRVDPRPGRGDRPRARHRGGLHRRPQRELGAELRRHGRALRLPPARVALQGTAAEDEVRRAPSRRRPSTGTLDASTARRSRSTAGRGMIGHNWGTEHAERWVWLEGTGFGPITRTPTSTRAPRGSRSAAGPRPGSPRDAAARRHRAPARRSEACPQGADRRAPDELRVRAAGRRA